MGTYVGLSLLPEGVSQLQWGKVYEESLELLNAFPFADIKEKNYFGLTIPVFVQAKERVEPKKFWQFCGDLNSKKYGETFKLYKEISVYKKSIESDGRKDILFENQEQHIVRIFDSKTQGHEYHLYILAIAMLIESRLPKYALVSGNIDYKQCVKAKEWADMHLSTPIDLPVRVDAERLLPRFSLINNDIDKIEVLDKWLIADQEKKFEIIFNLFSRESFVQWFLRILRSYSSPVQIGALKFMIYYLNIVEDLKGLIYLACKHEDGPKFQSSDMIKAIARTWICLPQEHFSFMKAFNKVEGHPEIVERQFGMMMLDLRFSGREIKTHIPLDEVAANLENHFPDFGGSIEQTLIDEISLIEGELQIFHEQVKPSLEISDASTESKMYLADGDAFLYFNNDNILLTEDQELQLRAIAYSIKVFIEKNEYSTMLNQFLFGSLSDMKKVLAALSNEKFHMILTEHTWNWIQETDNVELIKTLLLKLIIDELMSNKSEKNNSDMRKAMFENRKLLEKINGYIKDEQTMEIMQEWIKEEEEGEGK